MVRFAGNDAVFPFWLETRVRDMLLCDIHRMLASETMLLCRHSRHNILFVPSADCVLHLQDSMSVHIKAAVLFMDGSAAIDNFAARLPEWANPMSFTGFQASFDFS